MCKFFSFVTDGGTNRYYFPDEKRKELLKNNPDGLNPDSHSSTCKFFHLQEDTCNKYEYNPITGIFVVDQINNPKDDSALAEKWVRKLDFTKVVKELIVKPIINPFQIEPPVITEEHIALLKQGASVRDFVWDSVRDSVRDSVWASVRSSVWASVWASVGSSVGDSVRDSVGDSVRDSVGDSVRDSVWASVWASVRDSVWASVRSSVWASVGDSIYAYISSFFNLPKWKYIDHEEGKNPFQPAITLWEQGIIPSFDGTIWRLHTKNGIAWEGKL